MMLIEIAGIQVLALADDKLPIGKRGARSAMVSSARATADKLNQQWKTSIVGEAIRIRRTGVQGTRLVREVIDRLMPAAGKGIRQSVNEEVNEAFALGRSSEAAAQASKIKECVYSAILDRATCKPCEAADGERFAFGSDRMLELQPPYKNCEGRDQCRCVILYVYSG